MRTANIADHHRRLHAAGAITLHPAILGKDKAVQVLAEILHHIVTLGFTMHQHVKAEALLLGNRLLDMFSDAGAVAARI